MGHIAFPAFRSNLEAAILGESALLVRAGARDFEDIIRKEGHYRLAHFEFDRCGDDVRFTAFFLWLGVSLATRYVSIGSVVTAVAYPAATIASGQPWAVCVYTVGAGAWVIWRHRSNIARLRAGTENRINLRAVFAGRT